MQTIPQAWAAEGPAKALASWLRRFGLHPGGSWSLSWVLLFCSGVVLGDLPPSALTHSGISLCGSLFAGLTVVGALAFAGVPAPLWILPAALGLGLGRALLGAVSGPAAAHGLALAFEPLAALAAASIVWRAPLLRSNPATRIALPLALVAVAGVEAADALAGITGNRAGGFVGAWLVVAPSAASIELGAMWIWIAARELRIERAEEAQRLLEDKEAWLFDFFEKAPDMLLVLWPGTCEIRRCNRRFSETLGYSRRDVVGRVLFDFVDPAILHQVRGALLGSDWRRLRNLELRLLRKDGSRIEVLANFALRGETAGGNAELQAVLHDVTKLSREARGGEDLHRITAEQAPVGLFHADLEGRCTFVNPSFCEISGLSPERAREHGFFACLHPQDRAVVRTAWQDAARGGTTLRVRHRIQPRPGAECLVLTECVPQLASDGAARGFVGSCALLSGPGAELAIDALADVPPASPGRAQPPR